MLCQVKLIKLKCVYLNNQTMKYLQPASKSNLLHRMIKLCETIATPLFTMNQVENEFCNRKSLQMITTNVSRLFSLED